MSSAGLHDAIRTQGRPDAASAGKPTTLSSTITSGASSSMISVSRPSTYFAPSIRAGQVGAMNSSSWTAVGLRKTGAVSRMKSIQNWPGASSTVGLRPEPHQPLLEALGLERAGERLLDDEHDAMATRAQDLADADAVVGRPEGALREEDDGPRPIAHARIIAEPTRARAAALHGGTSSQVPPLGIGPPCAPS